MLGGWTIWLEGTPEPIYRFTGSIIPPFDGKVWITTSRESRLSTLSLGYFPHEAGRRYHVGQTIVLRDFPGNEIDRFTVRQIDDLRAAS